MSNPRHLLFVIGVVMLVVGTQTAKYPPGFLFAPYLWAGLAFVSSLLAVVCSFRPGRFLVASSGAILVTIAAARSLALAAEIGSGGFVSAEARTGFVIGCAMWLLVSVLLFVVWRETVVPWSIGAR